jgi:hypothetical protein
VRGGLRKGLPMARIGRRTSCAAATALLLCALQANAAEPTADQPSIAALLRAGADAAKAKKWDACIEALTAAAAIENNATTLGDLGLCEEHAEKLAPAHDHLRHALDIAPVELKEPRKRYQAALDRVGERVAILFVTVHPSGARVVLDGRPLGVVDGRGIALEPGTHTIAARFAGYEDEVEKRTFLARDFPSIHLQLKPKPKGQAEPAAVARAETSKKPLPLVRGSGHELGAAPAWYKPALSLQGALATATYASATALAASGATAIALEADRTSLYNGLKGFSGPRERACGPERSPGGELTKNTTPQCVALDQRQKQRDMAADVTIGTAIATGVVAGVTGLVAGLGRSPERPAIALTAGPQGGGIVVFGAW